MSVCKRVDYFSFTVTVSELLAFTEKPPPTKELRWIGKHDAATLPLVSEDLRPIILKAFDAFRSQSCHKG